MSLSLLPRHQAALLLGLPLLKFDTYWRLGLIPDPALPDDPNEPLGWRPDEIAAAAKTLPVILEERRAARRAKRLARIEAPLSPIAA